MLLIDVFQMFAILFSQILFSRFFTCFPPSKGELLLLSGFAGALSDEMTPLLSENGTWDRAVSPQNQGLNPVNLGFHQEDLSSTNRNWVFKPLKLAFRTLKRVKWDDLHNKSWGFNYQSRGLVKEQWRLENGAWLNPMIFQLEGEWRFMSSSSLGDSRVPGFHFAIGHGNFAVPHMFYLPFFQNFDTWGPFYSYFWVTGATKIRIPEVHGSQVTPVSQLGSTRRSLPGIGQTNRWWRYESTAWPSRIIYGIRIAGILATWLILIWDIL